MARLVYGLNQSLDGYVDHAKLGRPGPAVFRHFIEQVRGVTGMIYGRHMYEIMRYWDEDQPGWNSEDLEYAAVWRSRPKWVVSQTQLSVGPNPTLLQYDAEAAIRKLKSDLTGEIDLGGPQLAQSLFGTRLIDEYRLYLRPVVLGNGSPFFAGAPPALRLADTELIGEDTFRLTYVPVS